MAKRLAIHHPAARVGVRANPFGKDVANAELFRALARHGEFERLDILSNISAASAEVAADLLEGRPSPTRIETALVTTQAVAAEAGALLRGQPHLESLAWLRRGSVGDKAYSLLGLVHTLAPPATREEIGKVVLAPLQPWDAVICTSPSVQDAVRRMLDEWTDHLCERFGGRLRPEIQLPLIPLGVDVAGLQAQADRPEARAALRAELGLAPEDVLVLWVGRLSFFEKAFPQPMFRALEQAARATGARVHFAMAGWFPNPDQHRGLYEEAARISCPSVPVHFLDGNDKEVLGRAWAGADIFLSLVDNIQETFGITPLEAMASGLPIVASDWDGYRYTVRDGVEGFLIPTLGGPPGPPGQRIVDRHAMLLDSYQTYVGVVAQHTAVHIGRCAEALGTLIRSPELRAKMGSAGRERASTAFDWPVVARLYNEVVDELAAIRARAGGAPAGPQHDPVRSDPFRAFSGFPTHVLAPETRLTLARGVQPDALETMALAELDRFAPSFRATPQELGLLLRLIADGQAPTVAAALSRFPSQRRPSVSYGIVWLAKLGLVDWL